MFGGACLCLCLFLCLFLRRLCVARVTIVLAHSYSFFDSASTAAAVLRTGCCVGKICWWYTDFRARFAGNTGTFFRRNFRELLYHVRPLMRPFAPILLPIFILLSAFFHVLRHRNKRRRVAVLRVNFFVCKTADGRSFLFLIHASQRAARHRVPAPVPAPRSRSRTTFPLRPARPLPFLHPRSRSCTTFPFPHPRSCAVTFPACTVPRPQQPHSRFRCAFPRTQNRSS